MTTNEVHVSTGNPLEVESLDLSDSLAPELNIRESLQKNLPDWMQPFLTQLTGKPFAGQKSWKRTAIDHLLTAVTALVLGVITSSFAVIHSSLYLLLVIPGWILTIYGTRKLWLTIQHACAHYAVFGSKKIDSWLGEAISILTMSPNFQLYQQNHIKIHHSRNLLKPGDPTFEFLISTVGLQPGKPPAQLWKHLLQTLVSPMFHARLLAERLAASFLSPSPVHNVLSVLWWSTILAFVAVTHSCLAFLVAWVIPLTIFFQISFCLRLCVEHRWSEPVRAEQDNKRVLGRMTAAIFLGERTPDLDPSASFFERLMKWSRWYLRMLFYHLPSRVLVLTGDSPCHDFHHRHPASKQWPNYIFERQQDLDLGCPGWPEPYIETWGLFEAIDETLKSLSLQPAINNLDTTDSTHAEFSQIAKAN